MTAPVDVLTVLSRMSNQAGFARNSTVEFSCEDRLRQSQADGNAVAAVADLIAAVKKHRDSVTLEMERDAVKEMYAALARFGDVA